MSSIYCMSLDLEKDKEKMFCDQVLRGIEKKASLRFRTEIWEDPEGTVERSVYGLVMTG